MANCRGKTAFLPLANAFALPNETAGSAPEYLQNQHRFMAYSVAIVHQKIGVKLITFRWHVSGSVHTYDTAAVKLKGIRST